MTMAPERLPVLAVLLLLATAGGVASRRARLGWGLNSLCVVLLSLVLAWRWLASGHPPLFGNFEMGLAEALVVLLAGAWLQRAVGQPLAGKSAWFAAATLASTFIAHSAAAPLTISENSIWIDIHAPLAWICWALFGFVVLLAWRAEGEGGQLKLLGSLFVTYTMMGAVGIYYATVLFADPWAWDIVQVLGLLVWIVMALVLHLRLFFGLPLYRQRYLLLAMSLFYLLSAKLPALLPNGMSFHVFEVGAMAGQERVEP